MVNNGAGEVVALLLESKGCPSWINDLSQKVLFDFLKDFSSNEIKAQNILLKNSIQIFCLKQNVFIALHTNYKIFCIA